MSESESRIRRTVTVSEAAEELGVSRTTMYEAVRTGEIPSKRLGRHIIIPRSAIDDFQGGPTSPGASGNYEPPAPTLADREAAWERAHATQAQALTEYLEAAGRAQALLHSYLAACHQESEAYRALLRRSRR